LQQKPPFKPRYPNQRGLPFKKDYGFRVNAEIKVPEVRLVGDNLHELVIEGEPPIESGVI
jgi:hypothetical protein